MTGGRPLTVEEPMALPSGARVLQSVKAPWRDPAGRVLGVVGISRDITERKRSEREVARLAAIVESAADAIIGKSLEGTMRTGTLGRSTCLAIPRPR